jgi:glutamate carboxypeptidase
MESSVIEQRFLAMLEQLVRHESPTGSRAAGNALADHLTGLLQDRGWTVEREAVSEQSGVGDHQVATLAPDSGALRTLILTHYDTVWPLGTLEGGMPWRLEDGVAYGPGVQDMKSGIAMAICAVELLQESGGEFAGPVTLLLTSDEETGSVTSQALIERLAREHDRVFVLEPARDDGALKIGRKGVGEFEVTFRGVSSHAGNDPARGASALRELAHFLFFVEELGEDSKETTVNLTVAAGGSARNVIAGEAVAGIDFRALYASEAARVEESVRSYVPRDPRVSMTVEGGLNRPPMELTAVSTALWEEAQGVAASLGLQLEGAVVGGGSDGNFTSALGVATLDGLGAVGTGLHARHEQIRVAETLERIRLLAALLARRN